MNKNFKLTNTLFLDIETVSSTADFKSLDERMQVHWKKKAKRILKIDADTDITDAEAAETYHDKAAIFAEFGKIVCISVGFISMSTEHGSQLRIKSFCDADERNVLMKFAELLDQHYNNPNVNAICGHNIKEFDIPYICRRMLVLGLALPNMLDLGGKKPWETNYLLDTLQFWKFGDYKSYTSLDLLTALFKIPSPKDDIDGSQVGRVFWEENDLDKIATYCEKDVLATTQLALKLNRKPVLTEDQVFMLGR